MLFWPSGSLPHVLEARRGAWRPCGASGLLSLTLSPSPGPRSALQVLHKACEVARRHNYFPGGVALLWASYYESCIGSEQSCHYDVAACLQLSVDLEDHTVSESVRD